MGTNLERYKADLAKLLEEGKTILADLQLRVLARAGRMSDKEKQAEQKLHGTIESDYQHWYTESHSVIRQLLPTRLAEFESLYGGDSKRKKIDVATYSIQDWLLGVQSAVDRRTAEKFFDDFGVVVMRFRTQLSILTAVNARFESSLFDIRQLVQADFFDSELDAAGELLKNGFSRAAGVISGVVLEKHLQEVCASHNIPIRKKNPTIGDLNDALKDSSVVDIPMWRQIQRLGDLRNLCVHQREREPTDDEVAELVQGCGKVSKTVY